MTLNLSPPRPGEGIKGWDQSFPSIPQPLVSVVVVTFNGQERLAGCLRALQTQTYPSVEIILVDSKSTDESLAFVAREFPEVRIVALETNRGFAGGCNAGVVAARGDLIATLNDDARPEPTWLAEMVRALEGRPDVGMVASTLVFADDPSTINSTGVCVDRAGLAWDRDGGANVDAKASVAEVFGPCAGAALYRRALFDDVGLFDADFFLYFEDVDLAWRARLAGWRAVHAPRARVVHDHSASAGLASPFKLWHLGRNKVWLLAKCYPSPYLWLYLPAILAYDLAGIVGAGATAHPADRRSAATARILGRLAGLRGLPAVLSKRREVQRRRRVPAWRIVQDLEPLATPAEVRYRYLHLLRRQLAPTRRPEASI